MTNTNTIMTSFTFKFYNTFMITILWIYKFAALYCPSGWSMKSTEYVGN